MTSKPFKAPWYLLFDAMLVGKVKGSPSFRGSFVIVESYGRNNVKVNINNHHLSQTSNHCGVVMSMDTTAAHQLSDSESVNYHMHLPKDGQ